MAAKTCGFEVEGETCAEPAIGTLSEKSRELLSEKFGAEVAEDLCIGHWLHCEDLITEIKNRGW